MAKVFRAKFRDQLAAAGLYEPVPRSVWSKPWVVDILAVASGEAAFRYLAPYIFRVALSNNRIVSLQDDRVTFRYKDSESGKTRTMTLPAERFIHRFLQHVLPARFRKVRSHGLFSPRNKELLQKAKQILQPAKGESLPEQQESAAGQDSTASVERCPLCGGELILERILLPQTSQDLWIRSP